MKIKHILLNENDQVNPVEDSELIKSFNSLGINTRGFTKTGVTRPVTIDDGKTREWRAFSWMIMWSTWSTFVLVVHLNNNFSEVLDASDISKYLTNVHSVGLYAVNGTGRDRTFYDNPKTHILVHDAVCDIEQEIEDSIKKMKFKDPKEALLSLIKLYNMHILDVEDIRDEP